MTKGEQLFVALSNARTQHGGVLPREKWIEVANTFFATTSRPPRKKATETDEEWFAGLKADPALSGLNIEAEWARCCLWYRQNVSKTGQPTRQRFTNWLLKAERTVSLKSAGATHATGLKLPMPEGPAGWYEWLLKEIETLTDDHPAFGQIQFSKINKRFTALPASWQERCKAELTKSA